MARGVVDGPPISRVRAAWRPDRNGRPFESDRRESIELCVRLQGDDAAPGPASDHHWNGHRPFRLSGVAVRPLEARPGVHDLVFLAGNRPQGHQFSPGVLEHDRVADPAGNLGEDGFCRLSFEHEAVKTAVKFLATTGERVAGVEQAAVDHL